MEIQLIGWQFWWVFLTSISLKNQLEISVPRISNDDYFSYNTHTKQNKRKNESKTERGDNTTLGIV